MGFGADTRTAPPPPFQLRSRARTVGGASRVSQDFFWLALVGAIAGFVLLVFEPNRERIREARAECRLLEQEIASLEARSAQLKNWARALAEGDREAWAAMARERLGWLAPGERVLAGSGDPARNGREFR